MEADLAQAELRIAAALSREPVLVHEFMNNGDPHMALARRIFGGSPTKDQRARAKTINFGLLYGAGARTLWQQFVKDGLFLDMKEVRGYHSTFWKTYEALAKYVEDKMRTAREGGRLFAPMANYSWSIEDLSLLHPTDREEAARATFNSTIQSVPPRITLRVARRAMADGLDCVLQTHDGLIFYIPEKEVQEAGRYLRELFRQETSEDWWQGLPVPVDIKVGPNWAELKPLEEK